jgi:cellulose synthase (UDP-forming)
MMSGMRYARTLQAEAGGARLVPGGRVVRRPLDGWTAIPLGLFLGVTAVYLAVRIPLWNPHAALLASVLLAAELFGLLSLALHLFQTGALLERDAVRVGPEAVADILVSTVDEPAGLVRNTLVAAKSVRNAGMVWLLDDGGREEMRVLAAELGVAYVGRVDGGGGSLDHALERCRAEFIALFEGDQAPAPEFLERTLGYFADGKLAFVQTPQDYFNIDSFQHRSRRERGEFWHEEALFSRVIQPGKDRWNAAVLSGGCALIRRAALDDVGGFGAGAADLQTSLRLHKRGWRSVYHNESLAFGLAPADIGQYLDRRLEQARGAMRAWRKEGVLLAKGLTPAQRLCYLASMIGVLDGWQRLVLIIAPAAVLLTGAAPLASFTSGYVALFLVWLALGLWLNQLAGRGYARTLWMEQYRLLRCIVSVRAPVEWTRAQKGRGRLSRVTPAGGGKALRRLLPQLALAVLGVGAIACAGARALERPYLPAETLLFNVAWLAVCAGLLIRASWFAASRRTQRRGQHRFSLPVPVTLRCRDGRRLLALAQDLSLSGLKIEMPAAAVLPDRIHGRLHLPFCAAGFEATVVDQSDVASGGRCARLALEWTDEEAGDAIRGLLFGNSLQWEVNHWAELQRGPKRRNLPAHRWAFCKMQTPTGDIPCIARRSAGDGRWRVIAYAPFNGRPIHALELERGGLVRGLSVVAYRSYPVGRGGVFVGELGPSGARTLAMPVVAALEIGATA